MKKELLQAKTLNEINKIFDNYKIINYLERIKILEELLSSQPIHFFSEDIPEKIKYESIVVMFLDEEIRFLRGIF